MSEWWTYRPSDLLMFSPETYYRLFALHNEAMWPAPIVAITAGIVVAILLVLRPSWAGRIIAAILAGAWSFVAWSYFSRYATINLAAPYFGLLFYVQAALLLVIGAFANRLRLTQDRWINTVGFGLLVVALVVPPMIGVLAGRPWLEADLFGMAPDPTVLATLGVLLATADRARWVLLMIPFLWCIVTGITLWTMGAPKALFLPACGLLVLALAAFDTVRARL